MNASINVTSPKILDAQSAKNEIYTFIKDPPKNPVDAVKKFSDMLGVGSVVSTGIAAAFPLAAPILPILGDVFGLFSGAPSIGELTLDAIDNLSSQVAEGLKNLQQVTENIVKEQAAQTVNLVLQGADTIAREQSAIEVFDSLNLQQILEQTYQEKNLAYLEFLETMQDYRENAIANLSSFIYDEQQKIFTKYSQLLAQVYGMIADLAPAIAEALDRFTNNETTTINADAPPVRENIQEVKPNAVLAPNIDNSSMILIAGGVVAAAAIYFGANKKKR